MDDLDATRLAANLVRTHTRQPFCEHVPVGRREFHGVTGHERAVAAHHTDGQEAAPVHDQRALRSLVDDEAPDRRLCVTKPELERAAAVHCLRRKARATTFSGHDRGEDVATPPGRDHRWNAGSGGEPSCGDLAGHPAAAQRASFTQHRVDSGRPVGEQLRAAAFGGMRRIDPVHLGQEDE